MSDQYILDAEGNAKSEPDLITWAKWYENNENRIVKQDFIGGVKISTIFLGLDHGFGESMDPVLWETMIFGGEHDQYQERYTSLEAAIAGHEKALGMIGARTETIPMQRLVQPNATCEITGLEIPEESV